MMSLTDFRNRQLEVRVLDRCDRCEMLKDDVKEREHKAYCPKSYAVKAKCCVSCFESAKKTAAAEAQGLIVCC